MASNPFYFCTSSNLVELTGERANTLEELVALLRRCTGSAIFYHVFQSYRERYFSIQKYHSDFAQWISTSLEEEALAEQLGVLDIRDFRSIRSLREAMVQRIEGHLERNPELKGRRSRTPFFFCQSISVVLPTPHVAWSLEDFYRIVGKIGLGSIHYHFIQARLRLGMDSNDFSCWFRSTLKKDRLASRLEAIDIYLQSLDRIRDTILKYVQEEIER